MTLAKFSCSVSQFSELRKLKKKRKRKWLKFNRSLKEAETTVTEILMPLGHYLGKKETGSIQFSLLKKRTFSLTLIFKY